MKFFSYYRVSTERQGRSGLGLDAQKLAVHQHARAVGGTIIKEFVEIESGTCNDRPVLAKALAQARRERATLLIAKLDRLARSTAFVATLMESGADFVAADNAHANRLTIHILAAVAEDEARRISDRTRAALQAAKRRGVRLAPIGPVIGVDVSRLDCRGLSAATSTPHRSAAKNPSLPWPICCRRCWSSAGPGVPLLQSPQP